ncbi:MAG: hypothetical protein HY999_04325 [Nitrospinae bacterium]|nr:hypothetical protein [Nitrospinota bacterium]
MIGYWHLVWWVFPIMFLICMAFCMIGLFRSWRGGISMWKCCTGMDTQMEHWSSKKGGDIDE